MPLIKEDGSVVEDANSYADRDDADAHWVLYGEPEEWEAASDLEQDQALIRATRWVDSILRPMGGLVSNDQSLSFPRTDFVDSSGRFVESGTIPDLLKQVVIEAAAIDLTDNLDSAFSVSGIRSERYGDTSITYAGAAQSEINRKLKPLTKWLSRFGTLSTHQATLVRS